MNIWRDVTDVCNAIERYSADMKQNLVLNKIKNDVSLKIIFKILIKYWFHDMPAINFLN